MARPSADSLNIAAVSIPTRPKPPEDLTPYQREIWEAITSTKPPEWFEADTFPILRAYCIAAQRHKELSEKINEIGVCEESLNFMRLEDMYAKQLKALGVSMRLTQQSRYTPQAASTANKKAASGKRPWE